MKAGLLVTIIVMLLALGGDAVSEGSPLDNHFGFCWVTAPGGALIRMKDENGQMKVIGTFEKGRCLRANTVSGSEIWVGGVFVRPCEISLDPRLTDQWESARLNSRATCLWSLVEEMAETKNLPSATVAITCDIADSGVIPGVKSSEDLLGPPEEIAKGLSKKDLDKILLRYSSLAWKASDRRVVEASLGSVAPKKK